MTTIQGNAFLVSLSLHKIANSKKDASVTSEVARNHNADAERAGRYSKSLFAKEALVPFTKLYGEIRKEHEKLTLDFESPMRLLPAAALETYQRKMEAYREQIRLLAIDFKCDYQSHLATSREMLGDLFDESLYPAGYEVEDKFTMDLTILPVPESRVTNRYLSDETRASLERNVQNRFERMEADARSQLVKRILAPLERMSARLSEDNPVFRDTLISNLREITELIPTLNITNDPALERIRNEIRVHLDVEADALRANAALRATTANTAQRLTGTLRNLGPLTQATPNPSANVAGA